MLDNIREVHYWWCVRCKKEFQTEEEALNHRCSDGKAYIGESKSEAFLKRDGTA